MTRVTVAVPLYRRFGYLQGVLRSLRAQDHADLDILISDNGENGPELEDRISAELDRDYRFRRNDSTVSISEHFNQLLQEARGEYFVLLSDDDELSSNYISALSARLDEDALAGVALGRVEVLDEAGAVVDRGERGEMPPPAMEGIDFVRRWCRHEYDFVCFVTNMMRTRDLRASGGYPHFDGGTSIDNALVVKGSFGRRVAFVDEAEFRYRIYEASTGLSLTPERLSRDLRGFLRFLDEDPALQEMARAKPQLWDETRGLLHDMTWRTYRHRWKTMYRRRLSTGEWIRAAFRMPFIPEYYHDVARTLFRTGASAAKRAVTRSGNGA